MLATIEVFFDSSLLRLPLTTLSEPALGAERLGLSAGSAARGNDFAGGY